MPITAKRRRGENYSLKKMVHTSDKWNKVDNKRSLFTCKYPGRQMHFVCMVKRRHSRLTKPRPLSSTAVRCPLMHFSLQYKISVSSISV